MGAASSFPAQLSKVQAQALAGDAWASVEGQWPAGAEAITREQLEALVATDEALRAACAAAPPVNAIDEQVVGPGAAPAANAAAPSEQPDGAVEQKAKVELAKRAEFDLAAKRREKIAAANGVAPSAVAATPSKAAKPPKAPGSAAKRSAHKEQSAQLRSLLKAQRRAAKAEGRPPSRGMDEVECMLYVKPSDGGDAAPQVMTLGGDEPPADGASFDAASSDGAPSVGLPAPSEAPAADEAAPVEVDAGAAKAAPPVVAPPAVAAA